MEQSANLIRLTAGSPSIINKFYSALIETMSLGVILLAFIARIADAGI